MTPFKNLSCSLSILHENKREMNKGISKGEKNSSFASFYTIGFLMILWGKVT